MLKHIFTKCYTKYMKILHLTETEMFLKQKSFGAQIFGIFFAAIGASAIIVANQNKLVAIIIGSIFIITGLFATVTAKTITININKTTNTIDIMFKSLINKKLHKLSINQIKEVAVEAYVQTSGGSGPRNQINHNLVFYDTEGGSVLVPYGGNASGLLVMGYQIISGQKKNAKELGNTIADFMNIPFVYREPPSISDLIKQNTSQIPTKGRMESSS